MSALTADEIAAIEANKAPLHKACDVIRQWLEDDSRHAAPKVPKYVRAAFTTILVNDGCGPITAEVYGRSEDYGSRMLGELNGAKIRIGRLIDALALARSMIRSGESMSAQADAMMTAALTDRAE